MTIRVMLVDDHAVVRSGLHMILSPEEDVEIIAEADTAKKAIEMACREIPDVILMDISNKRKLSERCHRCADHQRRRRIFFQNARSRSQRLRTEKSSA